jgi:hypothetical protein
MRAHQSNTPGLTNFARNRPDYSENLVLLSIRNLKPFHEQSKEGRHPEKAGNERNRKGHTPNHSTMMLPSRRESNRLKVNWREQALLLIDPERALKTDIYLRGYPTDTAIVFWEGVRLNQLNSPIIESPAS